MITLLIFFSILIALFTLIIQYQKTSMTFMVLAFLFFILGGSGFLTTLLMDAVAMPETPKEPIQWGKRNAVILLGAGTVIWPTTHEVKPTIMAYGRIVEAMNQYLSCKKSSKTCNVIITGGDALHTGMSEAESYQRTLRNLGVAPKDMILEKNSMNTYQNAKYTGLILKSEKYDRVVLVTSSIHLKRALLYFAYFGIHPIPVAGDHMAAHISLIPTAYNLVLTDFALHEGMGIARLFIYDRLGLNKKPVSS